MPAAPSAAANSIDQLVAALPAPVRGLAERGEPRFFDAGELIVVEGQPGDEVYVLLEGEVQAFSGDMHERKISYSTDKAGDYFGEMALDGAPRSASVVALKPTTCAVVTRRTVLQTVREDPDFAIDLLMKLIARTRAATERSRRLASMNVYQRLVQTLRELAVPAGPGADATITEPTTHQSLAWRIGASREMVSRLMKDLETGGYVRTEARRIILLKTPPANW